MKLVSLKFRTDEGKELDLPIDIARDLYYELKGIFDKQSNIPNYFYIPNVYDYSTGNPNLYKPQITSKLEYSYATGNTTSGRIK